MGQYLGLMNFNSMLAECKYPPFVLNDHSTVTERDRAIIDRETRTVYVDQDVYSVVPSCGCGKTLYGHNRGAICKHCHTPVVSPHEQVLEPRVWFRSPNGVAKLINPVIFNMMALMFTKSGFNLVEWLCNTDYSPTSTRPDNDIQILSNMGVQRGYNNFVNNFYQYVEILAGLPLYRRVSQLEDFLVLIKRHPECVFSTHLPFPNKTLLILENNHTGKWMDPMIESVLDAVCNIQGIDTEVCTLSLRQRENRTAKTIARISQYYYEAYHEWLAKKSGMIRKNAAGTRCHHALRSVISSNTKPHVYDEIEICWNQGITVFEQHLKNKLFAMDWTPDEADAYLKKHTFSYSELLDKMFQELIADTKDAKGFYGIFVRNPTLGRGSTQCMRLTKVKTEVSDPTTTMSILAVKAFNADFDGDAMTFMLQLDNFMSEGIKQLAPHKNIVDYKQPYKLENVAAIPSPLASSIINWMMRDDWKPTVDERKLAFMRSIAKQ